MSSFLVTFLTASSLSWAAGEPARDPALDQIAKDMQIARENLEIQELRQKKILTALYSINKNLKKLVAEKSNLDQQKKVIQIQRDELKVKIEDNGRQTALLKEKLTKRLRAIYKMRGPTLARILFAAKNSADLERNLKILGLVAQKDVQLIKSFRESVKDYELRQQRLAQKLASLEDVKVTLGEHEKKLQKEIAQKNRILAGIHREKVFTREQIHSLQDKSLNYDLADTGLMDLLLRPSFEAQKGNLPKPVQGPVAVSFGLQKVQDQGYLLSHKGVFIASKAGTPVRAVFGGTVSFVGSLPGLGQVLILDHGDHYYTVYGNNTASRVHAGQEVVQGQVIASSGHNGFDQQNGLYFEVRHFSEPYDPTEWVKGFSR